MTEERMATDKAQCTKEHETMLMTLDGRALQSQWEHPKCLNKAPNRHFVCPTWNVSSCEPEQRNGDDHDGGGDGDRAVAELARHEQDRDERDSSARFVRKPQLAAIFKELDGIDVLGIRQSFVDRHSRAARSWRAGSGERGQHLPTLESFAAAWLRRGIGGSLGGRPQSQVLSRAPGPFGAIGTLAGRMGSLRRCG